jgi:addiction module HigA family antidote
MEYSLNRHAIAKHGRHRIWSGILNESIPRCPTADTALRLARFFGTSSEFWIGLQSQYDLDVTADALGERLEKEVRIYSKVA